MNITYDICWTLSRALARIFFDAKAYWEERPSKDRAYLIAANHVSYLDPPIIGIAFEREMSFLARKQLFKFAAAKWLLPRLNALPVDQDKPAPSTIKTFIRVINEGKTSLIFPEGMRSLDGKIQSAQAGVGMICALTKAPIIPARIFGAYEAFPRTKLLPRPHRVSVVFGKVIESDDLLKSAVSAESPADNRKRVKIDYQKITNFVLERIKNLQIPN